MSMTYAANIFLSRDKRIDLVVQGLNLYLLSTSLISKVFLYKDSLLFGQKDA